MVTWSNPARNDLRQIHDHISSDSKYYAKTVTQTIVAKTDNLADFPFLGRIVPEIDDSNVREIFVYSYRLIYEVTEGGVQILAVVHGKRDFFAQITAESDVQ